MIVLALAACGKSSSSSSTTLPAGSPLTGRLTVLAAASLTQAIGDTAQALARSHPGFTLRSSFAGTQQLARQVEQGSPGDVMAAADLTTLARLHASGLVDAPRTFARNILEIVVAPGNPKHITGLADLGRSGVTLVLADPSVPAGKYAAQILKRAHVTVHPRSLELDVKSVLAKVTSGEADAAIVYATDVLAAGAKATGVPIPATQNQIAGYSIAVISSSKQAAAARAFVDEMVSGVGQQALRRRGFLPPG